MADSTQYAHPSTKKKDVAIKRLRTQLAFSHWGMTSVGKSQAVDVSPVWHLFNHAVKVSEEYRNITCYNFSSGFFIFQQDNAPAHRALEAINFSPRTTMPNVELFRKFFQKYWSHVPPPSKSYCYTTLWCIRVNHSVCSRCFCFFLTLIFHKVV